jgi:hypothetical protein
MPIALPDGKTRQIMTILTIVGLTLTRLKIASVITRVNNFVSSLGQD